MKPIYECEWCSFRGTAEVVEYHERNCKYNPKNIEIEEKLKWLAEHCRNRKRCWDEYDDFWGCVKDGGYGGRHSPDCRPNFDCLQYCEGEDLWSHAI
jgi:hypothetical protein